MFGQGKIESEHVEAIESLMLVDKTCRECGKVIKVAEWSPHPQQARTTGMHAFVWGGSDGLCQIFVGYICHDCAWQRAMETENGPKGMIGGPFLDFTYG